MSERSLRPVVLFYALAFGWACVIAVWIRSTTGSVSPLASTFLLALAMPAPLVAALIVERGHNREHLGAALAGLRRHPGLVLGLPLVALVTWFLCALALAWLFGDVVGLDAAGGIASSPAEVRAVLRDEVGPSAAGSVELPSSVVLLLALGLAGALFAGFTINAVFAFGEEYGWRDFLWRRLGRHAAAVAVTGVLWGLWHAPLILLVGFNYPEQRWAGVLAMVVMTVALSWPLAEIRHATETAIAPAILHGMLNGAAGLLLIVVGGNRLVAPPTGVLGAVAWVPAGLVVVSLANGRVVTRGSPGR